MKKILIFVFSVAAAFALVSCANKQTETVEPTVGMANPWEETDAEGFVQKSGLDLNVPEGAENVIYRVLTDEKLGEIQFTLNGNEYTARVKGTAEFEDLSGIYVTWDSTEDVEVSYCSGKLMTGKNGDETVQCVEWFDVVPGVMYSLSTSGKDLAGLDITAVAEQVFKPMQGNAE